MGRNIRDESCWCTHTVPLYLPVKGTQRDGKEQEMKPWSLSSCKVALFPKLLPSKGTEQGCTPSPTPEPHAVSPQSLCRWHEATCNVYLSDRAARGRRSVDLEGKETRKTEPCAAIPLHSLHSQSGRTRSLTRNTKGLPQSVSEEGLLVQGYLKVRPHHR